MKKCKREINWDRDCMVFIYADGSGRRDIYLTRKGYCYFKAMATIHSAPLDNFIRSYVGRVKMHYGNILKNAAIILGRRKKVMKPELVWEKIKTVSSCAA